MKKSFGKAGFLVSILLVLSLVFVGCGGAPAQDSASSDSSSAGDSQAVKYRIGFSNGFSGNSWRAEMLASLEQEAAKHPEVELITVDGQGDINKQVSDIESLIAQKVDAIMVIPNTAQSVQPVLKKAMAAGIKVVDFNLSLEDETACDAYVGTNQVYKGEESAKWMVEKLGGKGNIVLLGGIPGNSGTAQYNEGVENVLKDTDVKVLIYRDCNWQEDKAKTVMADILAAYPEFDGIISDGGQDSCGALKAMIAAKRDLVPTTGDDYNGLFKMYVNNKDNYKNFDIGTISEPTWESKVALQTCIKLLDGETVDKFVEVKPQLIAGEEAAKAAKMDLPDACFVDTDLTDDVLAGLMEK
jgi:ribose transport system substrate-binding protein